MTEATTWNRLTDEEWERLWSPYDEISYQMVLDQIKPDDQVLEIGAGDLRLSCRAASIANRVVAIEIQSGLLAEVDRPGLPPNLVVQLGDARLLPFPEGITVAILLMRHCNHYPLYIQKLRKVGCRRLITNARWRMGVEIVQLDLAPLDYHDLRIGWYACECGSVGFKEGDVNQITSEIDRITSEVVGCPVCC